MNFVQLVLSEPSMKSTKNVLLCRAILPKNANEYFFATRINFENIECATNSRNIFPLFAVVEILLMCRNVSNNLDIDVNKPESLFGMTPLFFSSENGHFLIVKFLVQNDADVNQGANDGSMAASFDEFCRWTFFSLWNFWYKMALM